jgi:1-acyl-sn-glycerol-3-phosphate acyltransferase
VAGSPVQIVPAKIQGAFEAYAAGRKVPRPHAITLRLGPALSFPDLSDDREGWNAIARDLKTAVELLD